MPIYLLLLLKSFFLFPVAEEAIPKSIYEVKVPATDGSTIDFSAFRGKKILIVNTPIEADNNPQYAQLEELSNRYKGKLVIVAFLTDDFLIAPGSKKGPSNLEKHYGVTFPMATRVMVRTDKMSPVFRYLTEKKYNGFSDNEVAWDFQKYLIDEKGQLVQVFEPVTKIWNKEFLAALDK